MSDVGIIFKIFAKENDTDAVIGELKELKPAGVSVEEIAFGIKAVKAFFKFDDSQITSASIEDKIRALKSVSEIEVVEESLL